MDDKKQIEEMAKDLYDIMPDLNYGSYDIFGCYERMAKRHYEQGYRNCKDKVVLDQEEWATLHNQYAKSLYQARKETAREIIEYVYRTTANIVLRDKLAKQFGVEVEE